MPKPASCSKCVGANWGSDFTQIEGVGTLRVLIVGEASGGAEAADELPFRPYAESGSVLERCFRRCGYDRSQFRVTNILRCRPPHNQLEGEDYESAAISSCRTHLDEEIAAFKPRCILALGGIAAKTLTGYSGWKQGIQSIRGYILAGPHGIPVVCSYHPAFLRRGKMAWLGALIRDLQLAVQVATHGVPVGAEPDYMVSPSIKDLEDYVGRARHAPTIAFDIETAYSGGEDEGDVVDVDNEEQPAQEAKPKDGDILMVQFSLGPGDGIAIEWRPDSIPYIREILALPNRKISFNGWKFDEPKLLENGCPISGEHDDLMWKWHHLQPDLPRNLQSVGSFYAPEFGPWKHLANTDFHLYGCKDVDILHRIDGKLTEDLKTRGILRGYERHVRGLWPILNDVSRRGIPMSAEKQAEFSSWLQTNLENVDQEIQRIVPDDLKNVSPPEGFVRDPEDTTGMVRRGFIASQQITVIHYCDCVDMISGEITGWTKKVKDRCAACAGKGFSKERDKVIASVQRWARLEPFRPSQKQLTRYMRFRGHKVPKAINDSRESTAKLFLERMAKKTKDPLYQRVLDYRAWEKMYGTYMWNILPDGRVHPTFSYSPATGQLAATDPPCLTIPSPAKAGDLALRFRETIAARPGHVLIAFDYSGFHTSTFALEAQDPVYFRLANTLGDPHSFLTAVLLKLDTPANMLAMSDEELIAFLNKVKKAHKKIRDGQAKPAILGYALGLGGNKLFEFNRYNPDTGAGFRSKGEADRLIAELRATFPKGYEYQNAMRRLAHKQGYLLNKHGFIRWFWDVLHINPRTGEAEPGEQCEAAIAFNVQCDAHGHIKDAALRLNERGLLEKYRLVNIVHDELFFECPIEYRDEALVLVKEEMERPSTVLVDPVLCPGGLVVKVEAKMGPNMREMKGV